MILNGSAVSTTEMALDSVRGNRYSDFIIFSGISSLAFEEKSGQIRTFAILGANVFDKNVHLFRFGRRVWSFFYAIPFMRNQCHFNFSRFSKSYIVISRI